jgi:hypothetical protein
VPQATILKVVKWTTKEQQNKLFVTGSTALQLANCRVLHHKFWRAKPTKQHCKGLTPDSFNGPVMGPHNSSNSKQRGCVFMVAS